MHHQGAAQNAIQNAVSGSDNVHYVKFTPRVMDLGCHPHTAPCEPVS